MDFKKMSLIAVMASTLVLGFGQLTLAGSGTCPATSCDEEYMWDCHYPGAIFNQIGTCALSETLPLYEVIGCEDISYCYGNSSGPLQ